MPSFLKRILFGVLVLLCGVTGFAGPAPALSSMSVTLVISPYGGTETIDPGQLTTDFGHAGTSMTFWITEQGYGSNPVAKLNNISLTKGTVTTITDSSGVVVGFKRQFLYSGAYQSGGTFTYQNTSTNYPWNTMSVKLNILAYYTPPTFSSTNPQFFSSRYTSTANPTPVSCQFQATDSSGSAITYTIENATGGAVTSNMNISSTGLFYWDGTYSTMFTRSTSCPYPYNAQIYVVATNSHGSSSRWLVNLSVMYGPLPVCAPPPTDPNP